MTRPNRTPVTGMRNGTKLVLLALVLISAVGAKAHPVNPEIRIKALLNRLAEASADLQIQSRLLIRDEALMPIISQVRYDGVFQQMGWTEQITTSFFIIKANPWPSPVAVQVLNRLTHLREQSLQLYEMWCARLGFRFAPQAGSVEVKFGFYGPKAFYGITGPVFDAVAYQLYIRDFDYITYRNAMASADLLLRLYGQYNPFRAGKIQYDMAVIWDTVHQLRHTVGIGMPITRRCFECTFPMRVARGQQVPRPVNPYPLFYRPEMQQEFSYPGVRPQEFRYDMDLKNGPEYQQHPERGNFQYELQQNDYENLTPPQGFAPRQPVQPQGGDPRMQQPGGPGIQQPGGPGIQQPGGPGIQQPGGPGIQQRGPGIQQPGGPGIQQPGGPGIQQPGGVDPRLQQQQDPRFRQPIQRGPQGPQGPQTDVQRQQGPAYGPGGSPSDLIPPRTNHQPQRGPQGPQAPQGGNQGSDMPGYEGNEI